VAGVSGAVRRGVRALRDRLAA